MNLQALMKQAQSLQKNMLDEKNKINKSIFEGKSELVNIKMTGDRRVTEVNILNKDELTKEDIEILEDMIIIAVNDALTKINKEIESKMGGQAGALSDLL